MKRMDKVFHDFDERIDHAVQPLWRRLQNYFVLFSSSLLLMLMVLFLFKVFNSRSSVMTAAIRNDLAIIEKALGQIDKTCNIISIRPEGGAIDFLTVEKFTGSSIGVLNLVHPRRWKGPYAKVNPSIQGRPYELVSTKEGYFILPGRGVRLPNKLEMGKDIVLSHDSAVTLMLQPGGRLNFQGQPLALRLGFAIGDWDSSHVEKNTMQKINDIITEFNQSMPFALRVAPLSTVTC